uniref:Amino acid transporter transmembrane domain-containing protein n=1 Tax=Quercus lobata TaxID=97700 RepID=A0A7N2MZ04_QUELO
MMTSIFLPVLVNCLCTFQVYAMVVFDNLEVRYTSKKNQPCRWWVRTFLRFFYGGLAFFLSVTFPFLGRQAPLVGGAWTLADNGLKANFYKP